MLDFEIYYAGHEKPPASRLSELEALAKADPDGNLLALADLYPPHISHTDFIIACEDRKLVGAVVIFRGMAIPSVTVVSHDREIEPLLLSESLEKLDAVFVTICPPRQEGLFRMFGNVEYRNMEYQMTRESAPPEPVGPAVRVPREGVRALADFYRDTELEFWSDIMFEAGPYVWVRESEEIAAAGGVHFMTRDTAQLGGIITSDKYRRRGYARSVLAHLLNHVCEHVEKVSLYVPADNEAARKLYDSYGFETVAERLMMKLRLLPFGQSTGVQ
ncbi:MAG: GNAT family N-acetyltransferase [Planctomycetota bacterium]|jgi:RimJ/RimL family protein N-acetyltransferase